MSNVEWTLRDGSIALGYSAHAPYLVHSAHIPYGFQDSKGREVGCILIIYNWLSEKIEGYLHSSRDGEAFGPILSRTFRKYDTIEQAKEDVLKRALKARDRAIKKHQKDALKEMLTISADVENDTEGNGK